MSILERRPSVRIDARTAKMEHFFIPKSMDVKAKDPTKVVDLVVASERKRLFRISRKLAQVEIIKPRTETTPFEMTLYVGSLQVISEGYKNGPGKAIQIDEQQGKTQILEDKIGHWVPVEMLSPVYNRKNKPLPIPYRSGHD